MKYTVFILLFLLSQTFAYEITGKIIKITDGDTVTVMATDHSKYKIRLSSIDGAWVYRKYYKGSHYYTLENQAKTNKRGLWRTSEAQTIPPWEWRNGISSNPNDPVVKLSKSMICHQEGTKNYNYVKQFKAFNTVEDCLIFGRLPKK